MSSVTTVSLCGCQDMDFLISMSEERKETLAESPKVGVKVPLTDKNGSESLSSNLFKMTRSFRDWNGLRGT